MYNIRRNPFSSRYKGEESELEAIYYLAYLGYGIICHGYSVAHLSEVDILSYDRGCLVAVEVKALGPHQHGAVLGYRLGTGKRGHEHVPERVERYYHQEREQQAVDGIEHPVAKRALVNHLDCLLTTGWSR